MSRNAIVLTGKKKLVNQRVKYIIVLGKETTKF